MAWGEAKSWKRGVTNAKIYQGMLDDVAAQPARNAKRKKIVHPEDMPWEMARQGILKHLLNEQLNTRMETVDAYMQIIPPGSRSGRHRHLAEECLYVLEGRGYDLHQDCDVEITDTYHWKPQAEVKRYEWEAGDVIYIPPNTIHQHFNADPARPVRLVSAINRIYKYCGLNDLEQLEDAPEYDPKVVLTSELIERYLGANVKEQLASDLKLEISAVEMYNRAIQVCRDGGDNASRELFERLLKDEEAHVDWLEAQIHQIGEMGYERYLSQQIREEK